MKRPSALLLVIAAAIAANGLLLFEDGVVAGLLPRASAFENDETQAQPVAGSAKPASTATEAPLAEMRATYESLLADLEARQRALVERNRELDERERQLGVLQRRVAEGMTHLGAARAQLKQASVNAPVDGFTKLVRAFDAMDPDNAAAALVALHARDSEAALELLLALPARRAGVVLDALAANDAKLAAVLSHAMMSESPPASP